MCIRDRYVVQIVYHKEKLINRGREPFREQSVVCCCRENEGVWLILFAWRVHFDSSSSVALFGWSREWEYRMCTARTARDGCRQTGRTREQPRNRDVSARNILVTKWGLDMPDVGTTANTAYSKKRNVRFRRLVSRPHRYVDLKFSAPTQGLLQVRATYPVRGPDSDLNGDKFGLINRLRMVHTSYRSDRSRSRSSGS